jgi:hypothetical protein
LQTGGDTTVEYNANPLNKRVGDCTVRAISKALNQSWEKTYIELCIEGFIRCDILSANHVWGAYLKSKGFCRNIIPNNCPDCYTVQDFCKDHPKGTFILALSGHVVCVENGDFFDTWDSGSEIPIYYWYKEEG